MLLASLLVAGSWATAAEPPRLQPLDPAVIAPKRGAVVAGIYRGTFTTEFPAVAAIILQSGSGAQQLCSGTLITPTIVLTAGHCLSFDPAGATVYLFPDGVTPVPHPARQFAVHPQFNLGVAAYADVAVLYLVDPVTDVTPLPLATRAPRPGAKGTIVGFGDDGLGNFEAKLVGTVRLKRCPRAIRRVGIMRGQLSTSLCWKPKRNGNDTCPGDSGGPLLAGGAVAGVTSGGYGSGSCPGTLSWDTSVPRVLDWLDQALAL